jgi:hypothetical protein
MCASLNPSYTSEAVCAFADGCHYSRLSAVESIVEQQS